MRKSKLTKRVLSVAIAGVMAVSSASTVMAWTTSDEVSERETRNGELAVRAAEEGMVLLRNDGTLPLPAGSNIVLYGNGAVCTVKGGTGSGNVNQRNIVNYYQGLKETYNIVNTDYLTAYEEDWNKAQNGEMGEEGTDYVGSQTGFGSTVYFGKETPITDAADVAEANDVDCAFYVISRISGEGADRAAEENDGDYYLSEVERANLELLTQTFDKVVVILNTANVIDTNFIDEIEGINAVLLGSQGGMYSGTALANILTGEATPSGKLVDTWPVDYMDFPSSPTFGENYDPENSREEYNEYYYDDIYVGYRYFDTFNVDPMFEFGYGLSYTTFDVEPVSVQADAQNVTVTVKVTNTGDTYSGKEVVQVYFSAPDGELEKPYQELAAYGKTDELAPGESQTLDITYTTTEMSSYSEDQAAYILEAGDYIVRVGDSSRNTTVAAVLEMDETVITEQLSNQLTVEESEQEKLEEGKLTKEGATPYFYDTEEDEIAAAERIALAGADFETVNNASELDDESVITYYSENDENTDSAAYFAKGGWNADLETMVPVTTSEEYTLLDVYNGTCTMEEFVAGLSVEELSYIVNGVDADAEYGVDYAAANVVGDMVYEQNGEEVNAGSSLGYLANYTQGTVWAGTGRYYNTLLIPSVNLPDGPAGVRISRDGNTTLYSIASDVVVSEDGTSIEKEAEIEIQENTEYHQYCTAWPVGCMLAQTWNMELLEEVGTAYGEEMAEMGITYLLGPGMNIHRTPLCGRNFEYYSEDPVVTGYTAAHMTLGLQSNDGVSVTLKHFAGNNNENGRNYVNDVVSERALREIYLKGFEIAVKAACPGAIMTSYNLINGQRTVNSYDLNTDILREEWGFSGLVMSDYGAANRAEPNEELGLNMWANIMHSGNDWIMGGSANSIVPETDEDGNFVQDASFKAQIVDAEKPEMALGDLQDTAMNILRGVMNSNKFGDAMANWVDTSIVSAEDVAELQSIHNGSYSESLGGELTTYSTVTKGEIE